MFSLSLSLSFFFSVLILSGALNRQKKLQTELRSLGQLTAQLRASSKKSEGRLRVERLRLIALKEALSEISSGIDDGGEDGGEDDENAATDPLGDADTVAERSSGVFSDPDSSC